MTVHRMDLYARLLEDREVLCGLAAQAGARLQIPAELKGLIGTSGASSALPGSIRQDVLEAMSSVSADFVSPKALGDEIRRLVKSVYGDGYDAAVVNSCEAALSVAYDALLTPPQLGRGAPYRARCIGLIERHAEHHLSYGRPFPPRYKEIFADRGTTAGEFGLGGRRAMETDIVMVPMAGARYDAHGPKMTPCPLLMETDSSRAVAALRTAADIHAADLAGFVTLGYDTPGYGYGDKNAHGVPAIQAAVGDLAQHFGVPYVVDNAWGVPFVGTDPRLVGADVMLYSMDKVAGGPTSGLIVGRENAMVNVRRALGVHSERFGPGSAHGKGVYASVDPGRLSLAALVQVLRVLRDEPERLRGPIDATHRIVLDAYEQHANSLGPGFLITKSYNLGGVEINYERSWSGSDPGLPIFSNEDRIAGAHVLGQMMARMGVLLIQSEDGNIVLTPGLGTLDRQGVLREDRMRHVVEALFTALGLLREWADALTPVEA